MPFVVNRSPFVRIPGCSHGCCVNNEIKFGVCVAGPQIVKVCKSPLVAIDIVGQGIQKRAKTAIEGDLVLNRIPFPGDGVQLGIAGFQDLSHLVVNHEWCLDGWIEIGTCLSTIVADMPVQAECITEDGIVVGSPLEGDLLTERVFDNGRI